MTERRRELRTTSEGTVELQLELPSVNLIVGALVDISNSGFRVRHENHSLVTGSRVQYTHSHGAGVAVVIWTRVFDGMVESGLYTGAC